MFEYVCVDRTKIIKCVLRKAKADRISSLLFAWNVIASTVLKIFVLIGILNKERM